MTLSRVRANAPIDASTRPRASLRRRTRDKKFTASAQRADDDAYNAAMKAYSASPYEYKHELGLCACERASAGRSDARGGRAAVGGGRGRRD